MTGNAKDRQRYMEETGSLHLLNYCAELRKDFNPPNPHKLLLGVLRRQQGIVLDKHMLCDFVYRSTQVQPHFLMRTLALSVPDDADCRDPVWHRVVLQAAKLLASLCDSDALEGLLTPDLPPLAQLTAHLARSRVAALTLPAGYRVNVLVPFTSKPDAYARITCGRLLQAQLEQLEWVYQGTSVAWRLIYVDPFPDATLSAAAQRILHTQCEKAHWHHVLILHIPDEKEGVAADGGLNSGVQLNAAVLTAAENLNARKHPSMASLGTESDRATTVTAATRPRGISRTQSLASHKSGTTARSEGGLSKKRGISRRMNSTRSKRGDMSQAGSESIASGSQVEDKDEAAGEEGGRTATRAEYLQFALDFLTYERDAERGPEGVGADPVRARGATPNTGGCVVLAHDHPAVVHFGLVASLAVRIHEGRDVAFFDPLSPQSYPPAAADRETILYTYFWKKLTALDAVLPDDALPHCTSPMTALSTPLASRLTLAATTDALVNVEVAVHAVLGHLVQGLPLRSSQRVIACAPVFLMSSWWHQRVDYTKELKALCALSRDLCTRYPMAYEGGADEWMTFLRSVDTPAKWRGVLESQPADALALEPHLPCPDLGVEQFKYNTGTDEFWRAVQMRAQDGQPADEGGQDKTTRTSSIHSRRSQSSSRSVQRCPSGSANGD